MHKKTEGWLLQITDCVALDGGLRPSALNGPHLGPEAGAASGRWARAAGEGGQGHLSLCGPWAPGAGSLTTQCEESFLSPMFMSHSQRYGKSCTSSKLAVSRRTQSAQSRTNTMLPASH